MDRLDELPIGVILYRGMSANNPPAAIAQPSMAPTELVSSPTPTTGPVPTSTHTPAAPPTATPPPLGAESQTRLLVSVPHGGKTCVDLEKSFGFAFYNELIRNIYSNYDFLGYSVEETFNWPEGMQLVPFEEAASSNDKAGVEPRPASMRCILVDPGAAPARYYVRYHVTIYQEAGIIPDPSTHVYLTEGTAYLVVDVTDK